MQLLHFCIRKLYAISVHAKCRFMSILTCESVGVRRLLGAPAYLYTTIMTTDRYLLKVKFQGLDNCYSAAYDRQTHDQQRFTISEVATDWQCIMWSSTCTVGPTVQLADTPTPQSAILCLHAVAHNR